MKYDPALDLWRKSINEVHWSDIAKAYARCNTLVISNVVGWQAYGFRDISTGAVVMNSLVGVSSYRALYVAMVKYVASKRQVSK
jgi:hypothetical protein